ncbi:hypothetical protein ES332_D06G188000v1 [Gossypium tomentosum]|uniref:Uncharacterized protein n=1 Tax=Gossypium tomentosum TaxID=34277 RepID=A0A5D2KJX3_GOSTO|nr:hypothetical protein ES332_D06G188000v1 [Gossypium tomentosum]
MAAPNSIVEIRKFQKITGNKEAKETQSKILLSIMHVIRKMKSNSSKRKKKRENSGLVVWSKQKKTQKLQGSVRHEL